MKQLFDLRFVIGLFFLVVGGTLLLYFLTIEKQQNGVNGWCGALFIVFGTAMILLSQFSGNEEPGDAVK